MTTPATNSRSIERHYAAIREGLELSTVGQVLAEMRRAAGLSKIAVERQGPVTRGGLTNWEAGEPGVRLMQYAITLARMKPQARFILFRAAGSDNHEAAATGNAELEMLINATRAAWSNTDRRPAIRFILEGIARLGP